MTDVFTAISALATVGAAIAAWQAVVVTRRVAESAHEEARHRTTFDYLRQLDDAGRGMWPYSPEDDLAQGVLDEYDDNLGHSEPSRVFLAFMGTLNTLAYAIDQNLVDESIVVEFTKNYAEWAPSLRKFIEAYRERRADDPLIYRYAYTFLEQLEAAPQPRRPTRDRKKGNPAAGAPPNGAREEEQSLALPPAPQTAGPHTIVGASEEARAVPLRLSEPPCQSELREDKG